MKSISKVLFGALMIASLGATYSCSSSDNNDDGGGGSITNGGETYSQQNDLTGVYQLDDYKLTLYSNNTFDVTNGTNSFNGVYCYSSPTLSLSGIKAGSTRSFSLDTGKTYTFQVTRDGNNVTLKNTETGDTFTMTFTGSAPESSEKLTAEQEKLFMESVARTFNQYFVSDEIKEYTTLYKELDNIKSGDLDDYMESLVKKTLTGSKDSSYCDIYQSSYYDYKSYTMKPLYYIYNYVITTETYDNVLNLANMQGQFTASAGSAWKKTSDTGDFQLTYTAKDGSQWVFAISHEGSTGEFSIPEFGDKDMVAPSYYSGVDKSSIQPGDSVVNYYHSWTNKYTTKYYNVPTKVTATLSHNGDTRLSINVNINKFENIKDKALSLIGQSNGNATVEMKTTGDAFKVATEFNYANGSQSTSSTLLTKGTKSLVKTEASATPVTSSNTTISNVTGANSTITIMNSLTIKASFSDGKYIAEAYNSSLKRPTCYDNVAVQNYVDNINGGLSVYVYNKASSSVEQCAIIAAITSKSGSYYYGNTRYNFKYYIYPALSFSDSTKYLFKDYFTQSIFQKVIDYAKDLRDNVKSMTK